MAIQVVRNAKFLLDKYDFSGLSNELALDYGAKELDSTNLASAAEEAMAGLVSFSLDVKGFVEYGQAALDERLFAAVGDTDKVTTVVTRAAAGDRAFFGKLITATYAPGAKVGDLQAFSAKGKGADLLIRGTCLALGAKSGSGNGSAYNLGAALATQYLYGVLHVTDLDSLTSITVKIQSDDAAGFASPIDRISFTASTDLDVQFAVPVAGPITDTYWRALWTVAGGPGSATIAVAMGIR